MKLIEFKKVYEEIKKKHSLPSFEDLNIDFDIGRIRRDSGNLIRDIRRIMMEKIVYYVRLVEVMVNPSQASPIMLMLLKDINSDDKKVIDSVMDSFVELEIASHKLDVLSGVDEESKLVNHINSTWNKKRGEVMHLVKILEKNLGNKPQNSNKKSRDYFN
ncbi:MAG: hypothetical protein AABX10_02320 [Nanoarchaeota archaeon]